MNLFGVLEISGSAMLAQRQRAEVVASNLANAETTRTPEGGPYRRQHVFFGTHRPSSFHAQFASFAGLSAQPLGARTVRVEGVVGDAAPPQLRYEPGHPDANDEGYVAYPAINPIEEMVNLMSAARAFQANAAAVQTTKAMLQQSIDLLR